LPMKTRPSVADAALKNLFFHWKWMRGGCFGTTSMARHYAG
jgi:hypothetical protein